KAIQSGIVEHCICLAPLYKRYQMARWRRYLTLLFLLALPSTMTAASDPDTLTFFRAIQDKDVRNAVKYDHVVIREAAGERGYYVEHQPAYIIPANAIESIVVRTTKWLKPDSGSKRLPKTFNVTFKIRPPEGQKFSAFTKKNSQEFFQSRIGNQSLSMTQFVLPFEPDDSGTLEFTFYLREDDSNKLREVLSPFKGKLIWE